MFNVTIGPDDQVLVCALIGMRDYEPVPGSIEVECAECGRPVWRSPLPPVAGYDTAKARFLPVPVGAPAPTIVLCISCARAHSLAGI
jgi:hypothetical protein